MQQIAQASPQKRAEFFQRLQQAQIQAVLAANNGANQQRPPTMMPASTAAAQATRPTINRSMPPSNVAPVSGAGVAGGGALGTTISAQHLQLLNARLLALAQSKLNLANNPANPGSNPDAIGPPSGGGVATTSQILAAAAQMNPQLQALLAAQLNRATANSNAAAAATAMTTSNKGGPNSGVENKK